MLISRKVTEVSEISHVNLRAGWKELTKPINRSNSSLVQDVALGKTSLFDPHKFITNYLNTDLPTIPQSAPTKG